MNHAFDIEHARQYGLPEAVMISNFQFWIAKNRANKENEREGRTWTYNSIKAFTDLFPYLSVGQIRRTLDRLVELKVLITGTFNERAVDRTKWYAFFDECIWLPQQNHLPKSANASADSSKSLYKTDVNTDINTDNQRAGRAESRSRRHHDAELSPAKFKPVEALKTAGVDDQVASDWMELRKAKRLPVTQTVLDEVAQQAAIAGLSLDAALRLCCARGWAGFSSKWVEPRHSGAGGGAPVAFNPTAHVNRHRPGAAS